MIDEWKVIDKFFDENTLVKQQIDSFNFFIENGISAIVEGKRVTDLNDSKNTQIIMENVYVTAPSHTESDGTTTMILPAEARLRNLTYASTVYVDIVIKCDNEEPMKFPYCVLCRLPMMVKCKLCNLELEDIAVSKECEYDYGGYFIINGSEKVLIAQEKMNNNQVYVFYKKPPSKYDFTAELRCVKDTDLKSTSTVYINSTNLNPKNERYLKFTCSLLKTEIPIFIIFYLFGCTNHKDIMDSFTLCDRDKMILVPSLTESSAIVNSEKEAIQYIESKLMYSYDVNAIKNEIMNHVNEDETKLQIIVYMIEQLVLCVLGKRQTDDRDHYKNKRIDLSGQLVAGLFRQLYKRTFKEFINGSMKALKSGKLFNVTYLLKTKIITNGLKYSLATGNWGVGSACNVRTGVSQVLNRLTYSSTLSHLRRINSPIGRDGKLTSPRHLHNSHWGKVCPAETPEGQACGLVKNLALMSYVSTYTDSYGIKLLCKDFIDSPVLKRGFINVFVNGNFIGSVIKPMLIIDAIRSGRRRGKIAFDVGVVYDGYKNEIRVNTDGGRICRPLFIVEDGKLNHAGSRSAKCWSDLIMSSVIEYIDGDEEENTYIAISQSALQNDNYTHCEIHPSMMLGVCASIIPFANHNQSPRNTYQSAMGKQAVGVYTTNFSERMDTLSHILLYPQKPLVHTKSSDVLQTNNLPSGQNAIVAIATYGGYNQEDSIIMNQSSIDRGLFRSMFYRTYKEDVKHQGGAGIKETIEKPATDECTGLKLANYTNIDTDGLAIPGITVEGNDVIIGKTINQCDDVKKDISTISRHNEDGVVDKVMLSTNEQGSPMVKVRVRKMKTPTIGDKFCFTPDHELLTPNGWVGVTDIKLHDNVMTLDPSNNTMSYEPALYTHSYNSYEETLFEANTPRICLKTTTNHRMYVSRGDCFQLLPATALMNTRVTFSGTCKKGLYFPQTSLPPMPVPNKRSFVNFTYLAGYMVGGFLEITNNLVYIRVPSDTTVLDTLLFHINECGLEYDVADPGNLIVNNSEFVAYCTEFATNARVPEWVYKLTKSHALSVTNGVIDSNKTNSKQDKEQDTCVLPVESSPLADDIQRLALHSGISAVVDPILKTVKIFNDEFSNLSINIDSTNESHPYTGTVHCVTVRTGIIYVRRRGIPVWCGNSARHGQKGTIGMTYTQEDMPFSMSSGITPDIIINPHAIPSRMTIGQLLECVFGKLGCMDGELKDSTAFRNSEDDIQAVFAKLKAKGFQEHGNEILINGMTGQKLNHTIFMGPTYYQRLKHMVNDKIHSRGKGPLQVLTRQPVEGRARDGGLRIGEMERDAMISHGAASFLKDRLFYQSDAYRVFVCSICGLMAVGDMKNKRYYCNVCNRYEVVQIEIPFATKLLFQELMSMGITPRIMT